MVQVPGNRLENLHKESRILVVCHGNICRSPLAEVVIAYQLGNDKVFSRGLKAKNGGVASKKVRDWASEQGYDLTKHRSALLSTEDIELSSVILYMDESNRRMLLEWFPQSEGKLTCLASYVGLTRLKDPNFLSRGPKLDKCLEDVVLAAKEYLLTQSK